jgi:hypothetical protein
LMQLLLLGVLNWSKAWVNEGVVYHKFRVLINNLNARTKTGVVQALCCLAERVGGSDVQDV